MVNPIPPVFKKDNDGTVYLRDGITVAFFMPTPLEAAAPGIRLALERYLARLVPGTLKWASVGADAEEFRPLTAKAVERCRSMLSNEATRKRDLTAFHLVDGACDGDAPSHGVFLIGNPTDAQEPLESNLLQFYFPSSVVDTAEQADQFVDLLIHLSEKLPIKYGYASPSLHWSEVSEIDAFAAARRIAARSPGFDVQYNEYTRSDLGNMTRGARWLTWLGVDLVKRLGGFQQLLNLTSHDVHVVETAAGVLIRAGRVPDVGDQNRNVGTPHLCALAAVLQPVTLFDESALADTSFADEDPAAFAKWEHRFLDSIR